MNPLEIYYLKDIKNVKISTNSTWFMKSNFTYLEV